MLGLVETAGDGASLMEPPGGGAFMVMVHH